MFQVISAYVVLWYSYRVVVGSDQPFAGLSSLDAGFYIFSSHWWRSAWLRCLVFDVFTILIRYPLLFYVSTLVVRGVFQLEVWALLICRDWSKKKQAVFRAVLVLVLGAAAVLAIGVLEMVEWWVFEQVIFVALQCWFESDHHDGTRFSFCIKDSLASNDEWVARHTVKMNPLYYFWQCFGVTREEQQGPLTLNYPGCSIPIHITFNKQLKILSLIVFLLSIVATYAAYEPVWGRNLRRSIWKKLVTCIRKPAAPEIQEPALESPPSGNPEAEAVAVTSPQAASNSKTSIRNRQSEVAARESSAASSAGESAALLGPEHEKSA